MAERESDTGRLPRGGSDTWDDGPAGNLLTIEFFGSVIVSGGLIKYWDGASWLAKPIKYWSGTAWDTKPLKRWDGVSWITT